MVLVDESQKGGLMTNQKDWVDFRAVKAVVSFEMVFDRYGINWLRQSRGELRGRCPIHKGEGDRTFHANVSKGAFNCFSCHARGNVLDFVAAMENCSVRDAALKLKDWFDLTERGEGTFEKQPPTPTEQIQEAEPEIINPPLGFELKVDSSHEYGLSRGFSQAFLEHFGAGMCLSKGMFAGRFVIPLHNEVGELVGYAGRSTDEGEPKYLFPSREKGFYKSHLLFNLHRITRDAEPVVIVEGFFDVMRVEEAGYPCVGILGSALSEIQAELLALHFSHVILLFDGDEAGRKGASDALTRLSRKLFVAVVDMPEGTQPDSLSAGEIDSLLSSLS